MVPCCVKLPVVVVGTVFRLLPNGSFCGDRSIGGVIFRGGVLLENFSAKEIRGAYMGSLTAPIVSLKLPEKIIVVRINIVAPRMSLSLLIKNEKLRDSTERLSYLLNYILS